MKDWKLIQPPSEAELPKDVDGIEQLVNDYVLPEAEAQIAKEVIEICAPIGSGKYIWGSVSQAQMLEHWRRLNALAVISPMGVILPYENKLDKEFDKVVRLMAKDNMRMARRLPDHEQRRPTMYLPVKLGDGHLAAAKINRQRRSDYIEQLNRG